MGPGEDGAMGGRGEAGGVAQAVADTSCGRGSLVEKGNTGILFARSPSPALPLEKEQGKHDTWGWFLRPLTSSSDLPSTMS